MEQNDRLFFRKSAVSFARGAKTGYDMPHFTFKEGLCGLKF